MSITPASATALTNKIVPFTATVKGTSNTAVTWSIQESNGGTISEAGLYRAPLEIGSYHVVATSVADATKSATATVGVSAKFGFLEYNPAGNAPPETMTPMIGEFKPDNSISIDKWTDPGTGDSLSLAMTHMALSPDGKKAVFEMWTPIPNPWPNPPDWVQNIFIANIDGRGLTALTNDGRAVHPDWSPDGTKIAYSKVFDYTPTTWMMNADGTDQHLVLGNGKTASWFPAFSSDGTRIVAEVGQFINDVWWDGIATMNTDGTNLVQLTGDPQLYSCYDGHDEMPMFTHDDSKIIFNRHCGLDPYSSHADIYTINPDGTNLTKLFGDTTDGILNYSPMVISDYLLFESNYGHPYDTTYSEIYSIKPDGSGLTQITNNNLFDSFVFMYFPHPDKLLDRDKLRR